jgi:hypothetical protein
MGSSRRKAEEGRGTHSPGPAMLFKALQPFALCLKQAISCVGDEDGELRPGLACGAGVLTGGRRGGCTTAWQVRSLRRDSRTPGADLVPRAERLRQSRRCLHDTHETLEAQIAVSHCSLALAALIYGSNLRTRSSVTSMCTFTSSGPAGMESTIWASRAKAQVFPWNSGLARKRS